MAEPVLLSIWIPIPGICYIGDSLLSNLNCTGLLPTLR